MSGALAAAGARRPAPEIPTRLQWVNCDRPTSSWASPGRVVLLWFFSFDDVHCRNLLPQLKALADKYHDGVVVLGVHCARHDGQLPAEVLRKAVKRLGIDHPVATDPALNVWDSFGIRAWPSVAVLDAQGRLALLAQGEDCAAELDDAVRKLLDEAHALQIRVFEEPPRVVSAPPTTALRFPSRLLATDKELYVADSGGNRVLRCDHDGRVLHQFGAGVAGWSDGGSGSALFNNPQGMALAGERLFVADQGNHCVRELSLRDGSVTTVAGSGERGYARPQDAPARAAAMNAPVDLVHADGKLWIALAGLRQIWLLDFVSGRISVAAGSGEPGNKDGPAALAELGQPESLALSGTRLFVGDAGNRAIRVLDLSTDAISPLLGGDAAHGAEGQPPLHYPLALAAAGRNVLFVADCYDDAIKAVSSSTGQVRSLATGYRFQQPQGVAVAGSTLWVANTNAHEVVRIDLGSGTVKRVAVAE